MDYVPIRLSTLRPNINLKFDVYLKLSSKFIMYVRQGDDIEKDRFLSLKGKKVRQLFINSEDESKYQKFLDCALSDAANDPNLSAEQKAETASGVANAAVEDMHDDPQSAQSYQMIERASKGILDIIGKRTDVLIEFYKKVQSSGSDQIFKHAISTSSLTVCMAEFLELKEPEPHNMAIAAMILDIGMVKMPDNHDLFLKNYADFKPEDWIAYKKHPDISCQVLDGKSYINPRILQIVKTHEERKSGMGFPLGKSASLDLSQEVVALCSCYDRFVTCYGMDYKQAMQEMLINQVGNFELELIQKFKLMMKKQGFLV